MLFAVCLTTWAAINDPWFLRVIFFDLDLFALNRFKKPTLEQFTIVGIVFEIRFQYFIGLNDAEAAFRVIEIIDTPDSERAKQFTPCIQAFQMTDNVKFIGQSCPIIVRTSDLPTFSTVVTVITLDIDFDDIPLSEHAAFSACWVEANKSVFLRITG